MVGARLPQELGIAETLFLSYQFLLCGPLKVPWFLAFSKHSQFLMLVSIAHDY